MPKTRIITVLFFLLSGTFNSASGGPALDESIQINPAEPAVGTHPEITGIIKCHFVRNLRGIQEIDVVAEVIQPDKTRISWIWRNLTAEAGKVRAFSIPKDKYAIPLAGAYKVEFKVYTHDKQLQPVYLLSKTFVAVDPPRQPEKTTLQTTETRTAPLSTGRKATDNKPPTPAGRQPLTSPTRRYMGAGVFVNAVNFSAGPTFLYWPFANIAIQGSFGAGTYTSYELRGLYRFNPWSRLHPYIGAGYLHAETEFTATVSGNDMEGGIGSNSYTIFGGIEVPLVKNRLALYLDVSGTPLKLSDEVTIAGNAVTIGADYSPVSIGTGLVYYLW